MNSNCARWTAIADHEAIGDVISDQDTTFRRAHEATCPSCAAEAASWRHLEESSIELPVDSIEVDAMLRRIRDQSPSRLRRRRVIWASVASSLALAAAVLLVFGAIGRRRSVSRPGADIDEGTAIDAQQATACVRIEPGVRACVSRGSRARLVRTVLSDRRIELASGRIAVSLEPQPIGSGFTIVTKAGTVSAVGTEFSVEVGETVKVAVLKGIVLVHVNNLVDEHVAAHRTLLLGQSASVDLDAGEERQISDLLAGSSVIADEIKGDRASSPPEPPNPPRTVSAPRPGRVVDKTLESIQPADLLQQARDERGRGRFAQAADLYRRLQSTNPDSAEARVALVSLGDLQVSHLGDPGGALRSFDAYLRAGGGLAQEAWYGKIRALRELGRTDEERRTIERFLASYPTAVQASTLRARLNELR